MRKPALVTLVLLVAALGAPAVAKTGPRNSWTQVENNNWTPGSSVSPNCSPCVRWPTNFTGVWHYGLADSSSLHRAALSAVNEWSGQPYASPLFREGSRGCGSDQMCLSAMSLPSTQCGYAWDSHNSSNAIYSALVVLNSQRRYYDGPVPPGVDACDARRVWHHEVGHAFGEGHSAIATDLMWAANNKQEHVDSDSQAELAAVYGSVDGTPNCHPCISIQIEKQKLLAEASSLDSLSIGGYAYPEPGP